MKRYLILGSSGQLGSALCAQLDRAQSQGHSVAYWHGDYEECDITDAGAVARFFEHHNEVDAVINAAAFTAVDEAESQPDKAMMVNALGAGNVAAACREIGARLVHISTDFVFGDGHDRPIDETAVPAPLSVYGRSKWAGEQLALQNHGACAVLRTSGLYSQWGPNFVRSISDYARAEGVVTVVDDQTVTPTPASTLARVALQLVASPLFVGGVYHASAQGECSWFEFACEIIDILEIDAEVLATSAASWDAPAPRPAYCVLDNQRLRGMGLDLFGEWTTELNHHLTAKGAKKR